MVASKPNDRIFVYYTDHGGPGTLGINIVSPYFIFLTQIKNETLLYINIILVCYKLPRDAQHALHFR